MYNVMFKLFSTKNVEPSQDLKTCYERIAYMESRLTALELQNDVFRDKVLRKIQNRNNEEVEKPKLTVGSKLRLRNGN